MCFLKVPKKKSLFRAKQHCLKKSLKILHFFKGVSFFLSKNGDILIFRCYPKRDQEIVFCEGFVGKEAFLDHKNIDSKTTKT